MRARRLVLAALTALAAVASAHARRAAIQCESTADCADGETCVAGDSVASIQQCVAGAVCGGAASGGCPLDEDSGRLACIWREGCASSPDGCAAVNGVLGIYKCLSVARCDEYFGDSACSAGCTSSNGKQCNGKGSCQLDTSSSAASPSFSCACDSGFSGATCESGSDDSSGSLSSSSSKSSSSSSSSSFMTSLNASESASASRSTNGSTDGSTAASADVDASAGGSGAANNVAGSAQSDNDQITSGSSAGGSGSTIVILVAVLAAVVLVGAIMFAVYARKKRKAKAEEGDDGFSRADTGSDPDALAGGGADTPKNNIVTM